MSVRSTVLDPTSTWWRRLRGGLLAAVAAQIAALGHLVGGGGLPDPAIVLSAAGLIAMAGYGLARRRRGFPSLLLVLSVSQLLFHGLFSLSPHQHGPMDPLRMTAFHLVAAAVSAVVLSRGDAVLFRLAALWRRVRRRTARRPLPWIGTVLWPVLESRQVPPLADPVVCRPPRRGPPLLSV